MKKYILIIIGMGLLIVNYAQSPSGFQYQAIVRDGLGNALLNKSVSLRLSVLEGSASGKLIYQESHFPSTNEFGLVNLVIGSGSTSTGVFDNIGWGSNSYFLRVEIDQNGGTNYTTLGTNQLLSVPYALYAKSSGSGGSGSPQMLSISGDSLKLSGGNSVKIDTDPNNETQTLSVSGTTLSISNGNSVTLPNGGGSTPSLEQVLNVGNDAKKDIDFNGNDANDLDDIRLSGSGSTIYDASSSGGSSGKVLTETSSGVLWQSASGGGVSGSGSSGYVPMWSGSSSLTNSVLRSSSSTVGINTSASSSNRLYVYGDPNGYVGVFTTKSGSGRSTVYLGDYGFSGVQTIASSDYGVHGATTSSSYKGIYYVGGLSGSGSKNCVVRTKKGPSLMYCQESPENWFEDFGSDVIMKGECWVNLKEDFMEVVTIDTKHEMLVFITPKSNIGNWWIEKRNNGFKLIAPDAPDLSGFDYRLVAKRKHFEDVRLNVHANAYRDFYLYPENMGALPKTVWDTLKGNIEDIGTYADYKLRQTAYFEPHEGSPYNSYLPKNWLELRNEARQHFPEEFNNEPIDTASNIELEIWFDELGNQIPLALVDTLQKLEYPMFTYNEAMERLNQGLLNNAISRLKAKENETAIKTENK